MNNSKDDTPDLILDNEKKYLTLINRFKEEYVKNLFKKFLMLSILIALLITSLIFTDLFANGQLLFIGVLINNLLAVIFIFQYFFSLCYSKVSPKLLLYLTKEIDSLRFKIVKKYKKRLVDILTLTFYFVFVILIALKVYFFANELIASILLRIFIVYLFVLLIIPILSGKLNDEFIVHLNPNYYIVLDLKFDLFKHKILDSHLVKIHMKSNKLFSDLDQGKLDHFREINEKRWLPKNVREKFVHYVKPKYYFNEYSTIINFKKQLINLVSAIREWDLHIKEN